MRLVSVFWPIKDLPPTVVQLLDMNMNMNMQPLTNIHNIKAKKREIHPKTERLNPS